MITFKFNIDPQIELVRKVGKTVKTLQVLILLPQALALPAFVKPVVPKLFFTEGT